jgi:hypothetical protein
LETMAKLGELFFAISGLSDCHRVDFATTLVVLLESGEGAIAPG